MHHKINSEKEGKEFSQIWHEKMLMPMELVGCGWPSCSDKEIEAKKYNEKQKMHHKINNEKRVKSSHRYGMRRC